MNICFGIISWLPDNDANRKLRAERFNKLLKQLEKLWPSLDILVIAQNWQKFKPAAIKNNIIIKNYAPLGILGARKVLREEFLALSYDYIIMLDDDAVIECPTKAIANAYINTIKAHPNGFCFIHGGHNKYHPYKDAQLNLCAISKYIYEKEPLIDLDPQKNEGFEDCVYSCLLHHKYSTLEFNAPDKLTHSQFQFINALPSTWAGTEKRPWKDLVRNTEQICEYIVRYKKAPSDIKAFIEQAAAKEALLNRLEQTATNRTIIKKPQVYLYF